MEQLPYDDPAFAVPALVARAAAGGSSVACPTSRPPPSCPAEPTLSGVDAAFDRLSDIDDNDLEEEAYFSDGDVALINQRQPAAYGLYEQAPLLWGTSRDCPLVRAAHGFLSEYLGSHWSHSALCADWRTKVD